MPPLDLYAVQTGHFPQDRQCIIILAFSDAGGCEIFESGQALLRRIFTVYISGLFLFEKQKKVSNLVPRDKSRFSWKLSTVSTAENMRDNLRLSYERKFRCGRSSYDDCQMGFRENVKSRSGTDAPSHCVPEFSSSRRATRSTIAGAGRRGTSSAPRSPRARSRSSCTSISRACPA
jgi:hypothetical protein